MNTTTADAGSATVTGQPEARQLRRSGDDKMPAGVAGGIARYLSADVTPVRVIITALVLFTGAGVALYVAAWLPIPEDGEDQSVAGRGSPAAGPAHANPHDDQNQNWQRAVRGCRLRLAGGGNRDGVRSRNRRVRRRAAEPVLRAGRGRPGQHDRRIHGAGRPPRRGTG